MKNFFLALIFSECYSIERQKFEKKGGVLVALDVISAVEEAEGAAAKIRNDGKLESANIIAQAEADGKKAVDDAGKKASEQIAQIMSDADKQADDNIAGITSETAKTQHDLEETATANMAKAVTLIKERIVKG